MKRIIALLITALMLCTLFVLPASAADYTLEDIKNSGEAYKQLTHANTYAYFMWGSVDITTTPPEEWAAGSGEDPWVRLDPGAAAAPTWGIGSRVYPREDCAFIMGGSIAADPAEQIPAVIQWDVSEGYEYVQALVGAGTWSHSGGAIVQFGIAAVDAEGTETMLVRMEDYCHPGEDATKLVAAIPAGTASIRIYMWTESGNYTSTSSVIAQAVAYNVADGGEPSTGVVTLPVETFPPMDPITLPPEDDETDPPATQEQGDAATTPTTNAPVKEKGCGGAISAGALVLAAVVAAPIALKKKH